MIEKFKILKNKIHIFHIFCIQEMIECIKYYLILSEAYILFAHDFLETWHIGYAITNIVKFSKFS